MNESKKKNRYKTVIIVMSIILLIDILVLSVFVVKKIIKSKEPDLKVVENNIITSASNNDEKQESDESLTYVQSSSYNSNLDNENSSQNQVSENSFTNNTDQKFVNLSLYDKQPEYNVPFNVKNMLPGDQIENKYCIKISAKSDTTLFFKADVQPGYEKLSEVLKCKVYLLNTDQVMYDGLISDMPDNIGYNILVENDSEIYYKITVYLDNSVGNEYQNNTLKANFKWWTENPENLAPAPNTADNSILLWCLISAVSLIVILILITRKNRRTEYEK